MKKDADLQHVLTAGLVVYSTLEWREIILPNFQCQAGIVIQFHITRNVKPKEKETSYSTVF